MFRPETVKFVKNRSRPLKILALFVKLVKNGRGELANPHFVA